MSCYYCNFFFKMLKGGSNDTFYGLQLVFINVLKSVYYALLKLVQSKHYFSLNLAKVENCWLKFSL